VYTLYSRRSGGLAHRISSAIGGTLQADALLADWPGLEWYDHNKRLARIALFLLEELDLKLMENDNSLFSALDSGLKIFCQELLCILPLFVSVQHMKSRD
jgi:hypothetical protein